LGLPAFTFEYSLSARDEALRLLAHDGIRRVLSALGDPDAVVEEQPSGMSLHYMGTVRMGASDDGTSVCDTQARVWGYDNLFLGGNGVISSPLACNPTLTSVSLAVRGARAASRELLRMRSMV
ncbi:MAG: GMC oxidoreductase, partial [Curtobacterium sp.]